MGELLNPYIAGAPVLESSMFFGREDIFGWIERSLSGKYVDHILVIHGQRRVGKTSVLKQIPNFLGESYCQVFFDFQGRASTSLERFLYWMAREMARTLRNEYDIDIPRPDREAFSSDADTLIAEFLPAVLQRLDGQVLLLTFDEFDTLAREDIQDTLAKPLIAYLRRLIEVEGLNFIFSIGSSGNKLENMQASYTDFFKSALYRKISFLDQASCRRLITKPVEGVIQYDKKAVQRIYEITAGHPYFTQLTCHELFSLCQKTGSRELSAADVESVIEDVIERGTVNLKFVWDEASDLEKWILACLAQLEKGASNEELGGMLREQRVRFVESDLNSAVLHLREKDVLAKDNTFIVHLLRLWLQQNRPLDRVREELTEVNPIANRFIEIGDEYQDRGEHDKAIESYQQALDVDPRNLRANLNLGLTYSEKRMYQDAIQSFENVLSLDPDDVAAQTGLCEAYLDLGERALAEEDEKEAVGYFQQVLTYNESHADARKQLAEIYRQRAEKHLSEGKDDRALSAFKRAMDYTPEDQTLARRYEDLLAEKKAKVIDGWLQKADHALNRRQWDAAVVAVEKALEIDPKDNELQERLAEVKDASRQYQLDRYREQIDKARESGDWDEAIQVLGKAIQLAPEDSALVSQLEEVKDARRQAQIEQLNQRAEAARQSQDWDKAIQAYKQASEIAPEDSTWEERIHEVEEERFQAELDQFRALADNAVEREAWGAAIEALEGYLALDSDAAEVQQEIEALKDRKRQQEMADQKQRAEAAETEERWQDALSHWRAYLSHDPDDAAQAEEAMARAEQYHRISRDYQQAQAYLRSKKYGQAVELLQGIIAQDPTYKATSRLLVEAVEGRKEKTSFWTSKWLYAALGSIGLATAGLLLGPGIVERISSALEDRRQGVITEESLSQQVSMADRTVTPSPDNFTATLPSHPAGSPTAIVEPTLDPLIGTQIARAAEGSYYDPILDYISKEKTSNEYAEIAVDDLDGDTSPLQAENFALHLEVDIPSDRNTNFVLGIQDLFSIHTSTQLGSMQWDLLYNVGDGSRENLSGESQQALMGVKNEIELIVYHGQIAFFLNGNLVFSEDIKMSEMGVIYFDSEENMGELDNTQEVVYVKNLKFWNLDDFSLEEYQASMATPTTVPLIATQRARGTATAQAQTQRIIYQVKVADEQITSLSWSPSGVRYAAASTDNRGVRVVDGSSGEVLDRWTTYETDILAWSPDGEVIAAGNDQGMIIAYDPYTGEVLEEVYTGLNDITSLAWSPDGDLLAVGDENGYLSLLNTASFPYWISAFPSRIINNDISVGRLVSISFPQNELQRDELIVVVKGENQDRDHQLWYALSNRSWRTGLISYPNPIYFSNALWSLNEEYFVVGENYPEDNFSGWHLRGLTRSLNSVGQSFFGHQKRIAHITWSPGGDLLASASEEGAIRLWSGFIDPIASTEFTKIMQFDINSVPSRVAWSPDGDVLLVGDDSGQVWAWDVTD